MYTIAKRFTFSASHVIGWCRVLVGCGIAHVPHDRAALSRWHAARTRHALRPLGEQSTRASEVGASTLSLIPGVLEHAGLTGPSARPGAL
jgi:hypothetical protein